MFFGKDKNTSDLPEAQDELHWHALLRGQVLAVTTEKFMGYINLADQKAQAMIILNSILIPVAIGWADDERFATGAFISIITSVLAIFTAILCIYPKRRRGIKPDGTRNYLHFADIGRLNEEYFLQEFQPIFNDTSALAKESIKDLHDVSRRIIIPKFFWLKLSYGSFFIGNVIAIGLTLYGLWVN